jgi:hypothetical protein
MHLAAFKLLARRLIVSLISFLRSRKIRAESNLRAGWNNALFSRSHSFALSAPILICKSSLQVCSRVQLGVAAIIVIISPAHTERCSHSNSHTHARRYCNKFGVRARSALTRVLSVFPRRLLFAPLPRRFTRH